MRIDQFVKPLKWVAYGSPVEGCSNYFARNKLFFYYAFEKPDKSAVWGHTECTGNKAYSIGEAQDEAEKHHVSCVLSEINEDDLESSMDERVSAGAVAASERINMPNPPDDIGQWAVDEVNRSDLECGLYQNLR